MGDSEKKAVDETRKLNDQLKKTGQEGSESAKKVGNEMNNITSLAKSGAGLLAGFFAVSSLVAFKDRLVETTIKFEGYSKAIQFGSGSAENFAKNQQFLNDLIQKYGLGLASTTEAYKSFFNASTLAGQSQAETNRQFEAVTKAGTVLKLTTDQMQGAFLALGQMMSKGTVQAEELRGQLGERIPGAFSIMAKALNVNERQLNKMLEQGQVLSKDALPKFAAELEKTFGKDAEKNLNGLVNAQNRFNSSIDGLVLAIGTRLEPFLRGSYELAAGIANQLKRLYDPLGASFEKGAQAGKKASEEALKIAIVNQNAKLRGLQREFDLQSILFSLDGKMSALEQVELDKTTRKYELEKKFRDGLMVNLTRFQEEKKIKEEIVDLSEVQLKALKEQYDAKLKLLDIEKRISDINIEVTTEREDERTLKLLENAENFGKQKLVIDKKYAALGVVAAQDNAKLQTAIVKKQGNDVKVELKKQRDGFRDAEEKYDEEQFKAGKKSLIARGKFEEESQKVVYSEKLKAIERNKFLNEIDINNEISSESVKNEKLILNEIAANEDIIKANEEAANAGVKSALDANDKILADNAELYRKLKLLRKKDLDDQKKKDAEKAAITQASIDLAAQTTNNLFNLQSQYAANDFARKQKQFDEEVRLADGNVQKLTEIEERRRAAEKEYREKEFRANQAQAIANVIFNTAPIIAQYLAKVVTAPLAIIAAAAATAQIGFILAQPVPEFAEGTKGKAFKGKAIVGEKGTELVTTLSGKQYYTPPTATLAQFDEPVHITPNHLLGLNDKYLSSQYFNNSSKKDTSGMQIVTELGEIKRELRSLPVAAISLDEKGFMKKVRTPNRSTTILNNRFKN
jgi:tape measure domain-containing protein